MEEAPLTVRIRQHLTEKEKVIESLEVEGVQVEKAPYVDKEKGYTIPIGKPIKSDAKSFFGFNQYIVYDCKKIHMKYLLKVKINNK